MSIFNRRAPLMEGEGAGGAGAAVVDWRAGMPVEVRDDPGLKDFKDAGALARSYLDTKAMVGSSIRVPGPDAGTEGRAAFYAKLQAAAPDLISLPSDPEKFKEVEGTLWEKLGRPKDAKDYDLAGLDVAAGVELNAADLRAAAKELGLTKAQFRTLAGKQAAAQAAQLALVKEGTTALKAEWGAAYDSNLAQVRGIIEQTGAPQSLKDAVAKGHIDPGTAKWLAGLAKSLGSEPREVANQAPGGSQRMSPNEAQARVREIMRRPEFKNPGHDPDEYRRLIGEYTRLQSLAYPEAVEA